MWYFIFLLLIIGLVYWSKKKNYSPQTAVSVQIDNSSWEEVKTQKNKSLKGLKKSFKKVTNSQDAIIIAETAVLDFINNHGCSIYEITSLFKAIELPENLIKKELVLRKELNKHYKNKENNTSKVLSIYIAFKHAELQLSNSNKVWKNFLGLQKLQSNLKAEEYFESLIQLMIAFKEKFREHDIAKKITKDINRTFELWNSRNFAKDTYQENCKFYEKSRSASNKHFAIFGIIEYLDRRYKFNRQYRNELISWCEKDIELYEYFLVEFHEHCLLTTEDQMKFIDKPRVKTKKLNEFSIENVKKLKDYIVPRLNSFDILFSIYEKENNQEKLSWLKKTASVIGYGEERLEVENNQKTEPPKLTDLSSITHTIEVSKSGQKGKLAFLTSKGETCSTEDAFKDYMEQKNWKVMRAEVDFWQAMFCLSFWEEIFTKMEPPTQGADIPHDLFGGEEFYSNRKILIDQKFKFIKQQILQDFINDQIKKFRDHWTRLIHNDDKNLITYFETDIVQTFLKKIDTETFAKFTYRIAQNPNENRAGVSDFVIWNNNELKMVEVKKVREQVRESQRAWIDWMLKNNIPNEIVRVEGV